MASFSDNDYNNINTDASGPGSGPGPGRPGGLCAPDGTLSDTDPARIPARSVTEGLPRRPPWTLKDKVFHDLFSDPGHLLALYQTLHPEDRTATVSDLRDYIRTHEMEVYSMLEVLTQEYNDQLQLKLSWEDGLATGLAEGKAKGLAEGQAKGQSNALRTVARNMHTSGYAISEIAKCLGVTPQTVREMLEDAPTT